MKKPVLVIMAAGMGSRYGGLKQMDPVGGHGQVILDYSIYDARRAGFETVIFVIKDEIEADFKERVGARIQPHMDVRYAFQRMDDLPPGYAIPEGRTKPWGTAQAALAARPFIDGPFAIINADDYYGRSAFQVIYDYLLDCRAEDEYAMVAYRLENTVTDHGHVARGVCQVGADGLLTGIVERTRIEKGPPPRFTEDGGESWTTLPGDTMVSMNFWGFPPALLDRARERFPGFLDRTLAENPMKGEYLLPTLVGQLIQEGQATVRALSSGDKWYGVTYQEDKPAVSAAIARMTAQGLYPDNLWA
ncbi:MAG: NTP transferase domain-containing protein [Oscillospiraceae bacterium]|nr:NTP transferase domain-containing protein [Oscillospiraceae bacterium]